MKLRLLISTISLVFVFSVIAQAQSENNRVEFYGGYSYMHTDTGFNQDLDVPESDVDLNFNSHGFNASLTGNVHRYVGLKFDFSTHSKSRSFDDGTTSGSVKLRTNQFLGGIQFKDNRKEGSRVRPFAHILAGLANQKLSGTNIDYIPPDVIGGTTPVNFSGSSNDFAMVFGGGIDVNVSKRVAIRIIQFDYNPIFRRDQDIPELDVTLPGRTQNNWRIGAGIVFH